MNLQTLFKGTKIIETIQNYSLSGISKIDENTRKSSGKYFYREESFWKNIIDNPARFWGKEIDLYNFVISNWVARVPGLYWSETSQNMRIHQKSDIAFQSQEWTVFNPPGKSKKVLGGIGTLLLPPTEEGKVLMSVTSSCNASTGIPILVNPEVLDALKLKQGNSVSIKKAKWQPMDIQWSKQFDSVKGIPRGYLIIDSPDKIEIYNDDCPVVYHPFSIMEYEHKDTILYDFVYVTADSKVKDVDLDIEKFFEDYRKKEGRNGEYLLNPNIINPIFESRYMSPYELQKPSEKAKLKLLHERIRGAHFNDIAIELLINDLPKFYQSSNSIITLARSIGINPAIITEDSAASMSAQLITLCIEREIVEVLVDRMIVDYPQIFK
jgi:hypothetical protein